MKFYKGIIPNTNNSENFIGTKKAFIDYLDAFKCYEVNSLQQNYVIYNDIKIKNVSPIREIAMQVTYIYDELTGYFYHVRSCNMLRDTISFSVDRDTWAKEIMEHADQIGTVNITRTNLANITAVYDPITLTKNNNIEIDELIKTEVKPTFVFVVNVQRESQISSRTVYNSEIITVSWDYDEIIARMQIYNITDFSKKNVFEFAINMISGISIYEQIISGSEERKDEECRVIKAYIVDSSQITNTNYGIWLKSNYKGQSDSNLYTIIEHNVIDNKYIINPEYSHALYVGTLTNNISVPRLNKQQYLIVRTLSNQDGLSIQLLLNNNVVDITNSYEILITYSDGLLTNQQKIEKSINALSSTFGTIGSFMNGGYSGITGGITKGINSLYGLVKGQTNTERSGNGNGLLTFLFKNSPLLIIKYISQTDTDELLNAAFNGLSCNHYELFNNIINYELNEEGTTVTALGNNVPKFIKGEAINISSFTLDAQEVLNSRLTNGLKFKVLNE